MRERERERESSLSYTIAFAMADNTPLNRRAWSGTPYSTYSELKKYFDVEIIQINSPLWLKGFSFFNIVLSKLMGKGGLGFNNIATRYRSSILDKELKKNYSNVQAVFAIGMDIIADIKTDVPIVYLSDAVFSIMLDYYWYNVSKHTINAGNKMQKNALDKASAVILSSNWAKEGAITDYQTNIEKIHMIQFGPNHPCLTKPTTRSCNDDNIRLLFVGVDWKRKGLDVAIECVNILNTLNDGKRYTLDVIGCSASGYESTETITIHKFISDSEVEEFYQKSHIFILPTRAECSAIVFCEAASYGLPTITYDTGGTSDYVVDGKTGYTLPLTSTGKDFANKICALIQDTEEYEKMVINSRDRYETTLNWDVWGVKVRDIINNLISDTL